MDGAGGINVAWEGRKKFATRQIILHRRKYNGSWQTAKYFESGSNYNYLRPSITGHDSDKRSVVWYADNGAIYRAYFNGSSWSEAGITDTWLQHANISAGTTTARYVATSGSASPYTVYLVNETLPLAAMKVAVNSEQLDNDLIFTPLAHRYHRSASLASDDSLGLLWAELGEIAVNNQLGDQMAINLITVNEGSLSVTPRNLFDYLQTEPFSLAADAHTLEWQQQFYSHALEYLVAPGIAELTVNVLLNNSTTGTPLTVLAQIRLPISLYDSLMEAKVTTDVAAYRGRQVYLTVQVQGVDNNKPGMRAELGDIFIVQDDQLLEKGVPPQEDYQLATNIPSQYELKQNYPNPFNATTTLRYQLPEASQVSLKIYNLLGQLIRTLVADHQAAGYHTVQWDGRDDMGTVVVSGVYLYVIQAGEFIEGRKMVVLL